MAQIDPLTGLQQVNEPQQSYEQRVSEAILGSGYTGFPSTGGPTLGSKHDERLYPFEDQSVQRAREQSGWEQFGNMLNQAVVGEIVGGTIEGLGYLLDIEQYGDLLSGTEQEFGNWFSDLGRDLKTWTQEITPIYTDYKPGSFAPGNFSWWMSNMPSVASTLSLMIPSAGVVRGASMLARAAKLSGQVGKGAKWVGKGLTQATVSRHMENLMESSQTYEEVERLSIAQGYSPDEAKQAAAVAAADSYNRNWAMIAQDIPQYLLLNRAFGKASMPATVGVAERMGYSIAPVIGKKAAAIGWDMLGEFGEEAYQYVSAEESKYLALRGLDPELDKSFDERMHEYIRDGELWTAGFFGALGAGAMQTAGRALNDVITNKQGASETARRVADMNTWGPQVKFWATEVRKAEDKGDPRAAESAAIGLWGVLGGRAVANGNLQQAVDFAETMSNATQEDLERWGLDEEDAKAMAEKAPNGAAHLKRIGQLFDHYNKKYDSDIAASLASSEFMRENSYELSKSLESDIEAQKNSVVGYADISDTRRTMYEREAEIRAHKKHISGLENRLKSDPNLKDKPELELDVKVQLEAAKLSLKDVEGELDSAKVTYSAEDKKKDAGISIEGEAFDKLLSLNDELYNTKAAVKSLEQTITQAKDIQQKRKEKAPEVEEPVAPVAEPVSPEDTEVEPEAPTEKEIADRKTERKEEIKETTTKEGVADERYVNPESRNIPIDNMVRGADAQFIGFLNNEPGIFYIGENKLMFKDNKTQTERVVDDWASKRTLGELGGVLAKHSLFNANFNVVDGQNILTIGKHQFIVPLWNPISAIIHDDRGNPVQITLKEVKTQSFVTLTALPLVQEVAYGIRLFEENKNKIFEAYLTLDDNKGARIKDPESDKEYEIYNRNQKWVVVDLADGSTLNANNTVTKRVLAVFTDEINQLLAKSTSMAIEQFNKEEIRDELFKLVSNLRPPTPEQTNKSTDVSKVQDAKGDSRETREPTDKSKERGDKVEDAIVDDYAEERAKEEVEDEIAQEAVTGAQTDVQGKSKVVEPMADEELPAELKTSPTGKITFGNPTSVVATYSPTKGGLGAAKLDKILSDPATDMADLSAEISIEPAIFEDGERKDVELGPGMSEHVVGNLVMKVTVRYKAEVVTDNAYMPQTDGTMELDETQKSFILDHRKQVYANYLDGNTTVVKISRTSGEPNNVGSNRNILDLMNKAGVGVEEVDFAYGDMDRIPHSIRGFEDSTTHRNAVEVGPGTIIWIHNLTPDSGYVATKANPKKLGREFATIVWKAYKNAATMKGGLKSLYKGNELQGIKLTNGKVLDLLAHEGPITLESIRKGGYWLHDKLLNYDYNKGNPYIEYNYRLEAGTDANGEPVTSEEVDRVHINDASDSQIDTFIEFIAEHKNFSLDFSLFSEGVINESFSLGSLKFEKGQSYLHETLKNGYIETDVDFHSGNSLYKSPLLTLDFSNQEPTDETDFIEPPLEDVGSIVDETFEDILGDLPYRLRSTARNILDKIDWNKELSWLKDKLGNIDVRVLSEIVEFATAKGKDMLATVHGKALILTSENVTGTVYHEAFEFVTKNYLNDKQRQRLIKEAKERYEVELIAHYPDVKELSDKQVLHFIADQFMDFVESGGEIKPSSPQARSFFQKILDFLRALAGFNKNEIDNLFGAIQRGDFKNKIDEFTNEEKHVITQNLGYLLLTRNNVHDFRNIGELDYGLIKKYLADQVERLRAFTSKVPDEELRTQQIANIYDRILNDFSEFRELTQDYLGQLSIKPTVSEEEQENEFERFEKAPHEISAKDNILTEIKLMVATLPTGELHSLTGLPKFVDFGSMWAEVMNLVHDAPNPDAMIERLEQKAADSAPYHTLLYGSEKTDRLGLKTSEELKTKFFTSMYKHRNAFVDYRYRAARNQAIRSGATKSSFTRTQSTRYLNLWSQKFVGSNLFNTDKTLNKTVAKNRLNEYGELVKDMRNIFKSGGKLSQDTYDNLKAKIIALYNGISVPIDNTTLTHILQQKALNRDNAMNNFVIKDMRGVFGEGGMIGSMSKGQQKRDRNNNLIEPHKYLASEGNIKDIAVAFSEIRPENMETAILGPGGNTYFVYSAPNPTTDLINGLRYDNTLLTRLSNVTYNQNSTFLRQIAEGKQLGVQTFSTFVKEGVGDPGREYLAISPIEDYVLKFSAVMNGSIPLPTLADRKTLYLWTGLDTVKFDAAVEKGKLVIPQQIIDIFEGYRTDEKNRIKGAKEAVNWAIENDDYSNLVEGYHYSTNENGKPVYLNKAGKYTGNAMKHTHFNSTKSTEEILRSIIDKEVRAAASVGVITLNDDGKPFTNVYLPEEYISKAGYESDELGMEALIAEYAINTMMSTIETEKLISGDPAFYKETDGEVHDDKVKRLAALAASGDKVASNYTNPTDPDLAKNKYKTITLNTQEFYSPFYEILVKQHSEVYRRLGASEEEAHKIAATKLKAYKNVDQTDAQVYISPNMYRQISKRLGEWTDDKQRAFELLEGDQKLTAAQEVQALKIVMQPLKLVYYKLHYEGGLAIPVYDKMSMATIFKRTAKGTQLEPLYDRMTRANNPIDVVKFDSAVKAGNRQQVNYFKSDDQAEVNEKGLDSAIMYDQFFDGLYRQVITEPHEIKRQLLGTQMKKVGMSNIMRAGEYTVSGKKMNGTDVINIINGALRGLSNKGKQELVRRLGVSESMPEIIDTEKLAEMLRREAVLAGMPNNIVDAIGVDENGELFVEFDAFPDRAWIENRLISVVSKRTVDLKTFGGGFTQMSNFGLRNVTDLEDSDLKLVNERGKTEIMISIGLFKHAIPNYENKTFEEAKAWVKANFEGIGYRIPTQGLNSIIAFEVKEFLPEQVGDTVVLPTEFTALTGSDFDLDKLFIAAYNYKARLTGKVEKVKFIDANTKTEEGIRKVYDARYGGVLNTIKDIESKVRDIERDITEEEERAAEGLDPSVAKTILGAFDHSALINSLVGELQDFISEEEIDEMLQAETEGVLSLKLYKELKDIEIPTFEEFMHSNLGKNIYEVNSRKAVENRLLDGYTAVLTSPLHTIDNTTPLDAYTSRLKNWAKEVRRLEGRGRRLSALEATTPSYQSEVKTKFTDGKDGIAPFALNNVHHALGQIHNLGIFFDDILAGKWHYDENAVDLSKERDMNGVLILNWLSAFINAHVDVAKDPYIIDLNIRPATYNVANMMLRAGAEAKLVGYILSQPILKDYASTDRRIKGDIGGVRGGKPGRIVRNAWQRTHRITNKEINTVNLEELLTIDSLTNLMKGAKNRSWAVKQMAILRWFTQANSAAFSLNEVVQASQIDTKKFGSNMSQMVVFMNRFQRVVDEGKIRNFDSLINDSFLGTLLENSVNLSRKMFRRMTISNSSGFNDIFRTLLAQRRMKYAREPRDINRMSNALHSVLISEYFTSPRGMAMNSESIDNMLFGKNSLANIIWTIKQGKGDMKHLKNNALIQALDPIFPDNIKEPRYLAILSFGKRDKWSKDTLSRAWADLFNDNSTDEKVRAKVRRLASSLMAYSFVTSGYKMGLNSFYQFMPVEAVKYVPEHLSGGITVSYSDFVKELRQALNSEGSEALTDGLLDELYLNNWNEDLFIPSLGYDEVFLRFNFKHPHTMLFTAATAEDLFYGYNHNGELLFAPYVKFNDPKRGWVLGKYIGYHSDTLKPVYKTVNKKGFFAPTVRVHETGTNTIFENNKFPESELIHAQNEHKIKHTQIYPNFVHVEDQVLAEYDTNLPDPTGVERIVEDKTMNMTFPGQFENVVSGLKTQTTRENKNNYNVGDRVKVVDKKGSSVLVDITYVEPVDINEIHVLPENHEYFTLEGRENNKEWFVKNTQYLKDKKNVVKIGFKKAPEKTVEGGIEFEEEQSTGYRERTIKNASADATIAIAIDFNSAGERLTKNSVLNQKKKYIPIDANSLQVTEERVNKIVVKLNEVKAKSLNIAGNGIYTMSGKYSQEEVDNFTYDLLKAVVNSPLLQNKIEFIRTGGQTGFDEAGAKAGRKLGIKTLILAPKGWKFRNKEGTDISNEKAFKNRFEEGIQYDQRIGAPIDETVRLKEILAELKRKDLTSVQRAELEAELTDLYFKEPGERVTSEEKDALREERGLPPIITQATITKFLRDSKAMNKQMFGGFDNWIALGRKRSALPASRRVIFKLNKKYEKYGKLITLIQKEDSWLIEISAAVLAKYNVDQTQSQRLVETTRDDSEHLTRKEFDVQLKVLFKTFPGVTIRIDEEIPAVGQLKQVDGKSVIGVNPLYWTRDTLGHEFGHLLIDLIGGLDNRLVKQGREFLKGTKLEKDIYERYPDLVKAKDDRIHKEVLAQAIGLETAQIFKEENEMKRWERWLIRFFRRVRQLLGLESSAVRKLAKRLVKGVPLTAEEMRGQPSIYAQYQQVDPEVAEDVLKLEKDPITDVGRLKNLAIQSLEKKIAIYRQRGKQAPLEGLELQLKKLQAEDNPAKLFRNFIDFTRRQVNGVVDKYHRAERRDRINSGKLERGEIEDFETAFTAKELHTWKDYVVAYGTVLTEVKNALLEYKNSPVVRGDIHRGSRVERIDKRIAEVDGILDNVSFISQAYITKGVELLKDFLSPYSTYLRGLYREGAERQWNKLSKAEKEAMPLDEYLDQKTAENADAIEAKSRELIGKELMKASRDINFLGRWIDNLLDSPDLVIQSMVKKFSIVDEQSRLESIKMRNRMIEVLRRLEKTQSAGDQRKFYGFILERDNIGNETQHLVSPYHSSLWRDYNALGVELENNPELTPEEIREQKNKWKKRNAPRTESDKRAYNKARKEFINQMIADGLIHESEVIKIDSYEANKGSTQYYRPLSEYIESDDAIEAYRAFQATTTWQFRTPVSKYRNPQWKALLKMADVDPKLSITEQEAELKKNKTNDTRIEFYNLIKEVSEEADKNLPYNFRLRERLPAIAKDLSERVREQQAIGTVIKEESKLGALRRPEDIERGQLEITTEGGDPVNFVPIFYTHEIEPENQSYDLATIYHRYWTMANDYAKKTDILPEMEMVKFFVENREVIRTDEQGNVIKDALDRVGERALTKTGAKSFITQQLDDWFKSIVYGQREKFEGTWSLFGAKIDKAKAANMLNKYTALNLLGLNVVQGFANVALGQTLQWAESFGGEFYNVKDFAKAGMYYTKHLPGIMGDIGARAPNNIISLINEEFNTLNEYENGKYRRNSKFQQLMTSDTLFFTTHAGEHYMQSRVVVAMLHRMKARDKSGKVIGNMLDQLYAENGELKVKKEVANFGQEARIGFGLKARRLLSRLHGEYSENGKVAVQRLALGRMGYMFRKFVVPGYKRRWERKKYNELLEEFTEGNYITTARFFKNLIKDMRVFRLALASESWNELTRMEKANIRRTMGEVIFLISTLILISVFMKLRDEDEEEWLWNFMAYQAVRLKTELLFFSPKLDEALRILRSPAATMSVFENVIKLTSQIFNPFDRYERGHWKGKPKIAKTLVNFVPGLRQGYRLAYIDDQIGWFTN